MAVEAKRGCGYRKVGGIYMVGGLGGRVCHRLPMKMTICPCCGEGIQQTRGWKWVDPVKLFGHCTCQDAADDKGLCPATCFICNPAPWCESMDVKRHGLVWIGEGFYKTPEDFTREANALGVSRRIKAVPKGYIPGKTWVLLGHPKAVELEEPHVDRKGQSDAFKPKMGPGIFHAFLPERIEIIVTDKTGKRKLAALKKKGLTPVIVPHDDKDHRGSVYDKGGKDA